MLVHFIGGGVADAAVAGENPFEIVGKKFFHGARLLRPGIPADVAEGRERFTLGRPGEVVACEENFISIKKNLVAARVSRSGDELQIGVNWQGSRSGDDALDASRRGGFRFVQDSRAMEVGRKFCVVGNIVAMREQHELNAAHFLHALH